MPASEAAGEVVGEAVGKIAGHKVGITLMEVLSVMGPPAGICFMETLNNSSQLFVSPPCASQMPDPLFGRLIDYTSQCLHERLHLSTCKLFLLVRIMVSSFR